MADLVGSIISALGGDDNSSTSSAQASSTTQTSTTTKTFAGPSDEPAGTSASSHKSQASTPTKASSFGSATGSTSLFQPSSTVRATESSASPTVTANLTPANAKNVQTPASTVETSDSSTSTSTTATTIPSSLSTGSIIFVTGPDSSTTFATSTSTSASSSVPSISSPPEALSSATASSTPTKPSPSPASSTDHHIPVAGIVVASAMGFMALMGVLFLIFRYCKPIRRRWDLWQEQKRLARSYRSALDGPGALSDKSSVESLPKTNIFPTQHYHTNEPPTPGAQMTQAQGTGLGIGSRLSLLMQHSPFQTGDRAQNVRRSQIGVAVSGSRYDRDLPPLPR